MIPADELEVMARVPIFAALPPSALRRLGDLADRKSTRLNSSH